MYLTWMFVSDVDNIATARQAQPQPAIQAIKLLLCKRGLFSAPSQNSIHIFG